MKKALIFTLFVFFLIVLHGQEKTLITEDRVWSYLQDNCTPGVTEYKSFYMRFKGDTLMNDNHYKKVQIAEDEDARQWAYTNEFVREEDDRVYYFNEFLETEFLIYDFSLEVGEEITVWNPLAPDGIKLFVTKIDSVLTVDGLHKRLELKIDEFSSSEYWIEGIGSEYGLLNSGGGVFLGICGNYLLLCASIEGWQVYQNPNYETCYFNLLDDPETAANDLKINYIPLLRKLEISSAQRQATKIMVTSVSGSVLLLRTINPTGSEIDLSSFKPGLYIVSAVVKNSVLSKKIVVY